MRIGIQTWGSEGDVRPLLAWADHLAARGHTVTLAISPLGQVDIPPTVPGRTVRFIPEGPGADLAAFTRTLGERPRPVRVLKGLIQELLLPILPAMEAAAQDLAASNDVLIGHFIAHPLHAAAQAARKPFVSVCYAPLIVPTSSTPPQALPNLGRWLNPGLWWLEDQLLNRLLGATCRGTFARLGVVPGPRQVRQAWLSPHLNLIAASPALCKRPADWGAQHVLTGEFIRPTPPSALPSDITAFLAAGESPVYLGLGSPQQARPEEGTARLADAARRWGGRALVRTLDPAIPPGTTDGQILFCGALDHRTLFPRCAAVVHHGGAGTTHAAARAGVPSLAVTFIDEQTAWGRIIAHNMAGAPPIPFHRGDVDTIARGISRALVPACRTGATALAARMAGEDGLATATARIEGLRIPSEQ